VLHPEEAAVVWAMLDHAAAQRVAASAAGDSAESPGVDAEVGADAEVVDRVVERAVDVARIRSVGDSAESPATRSELRRREVAQRCAFDRADALVSIAQGYVRGDRPDRSPIEVTITLEERGLREATVAAEVGAEVAELADGFVSSMAARRLACDAGVVELREAPDGTPLALGRKRRTVSGALKRALLRRDAMCCFPGCTHRKFLEGHHLQHWADGGETNLSNLALVCDFHHRFVHEYGYTVDLGSDQRPRFRDPKGHTVEAQPARPGPPGLGWPAIRTAHAALALHAETAGAGWDGTHVDYPALVGHLLVAGAVTTHA
jgi:Domain of unknown function (DUF222)/HNH endonuclease